MTNYRKKLKIGTNTNFGSANWKIQFSKTENLQMKVKKKKKKKILKLSDQPQNWHRD